MVEPVTIGYGVNKWLKDADTKVLALYDQNGSSTHSMHSSSDGLAYQVPVGKKFIILSINFYGTDMVVSYDPVIDNYGTELYLVLGATALPPVPVWIEIAAGNYINVYVTGVNAKSSMIGIETTV